MQIAFRVDCFQVLLDGKAHLVDSSELAFKAATKHAFKEAFLKAAPSLLEPIMNLQVQIPGEFQGQVIGALSKRRGVSFDIRSEFFSFEQTMGRAENSNLTDFYRAVGCNELNIN